MNDEPKTSHPLRATRAWQLTLALYALLLLSLGMEHVVMRPVFLLPVWLMYTVPLLLVAKGLLERRPRSAIWLCFMVLFHFLASVDRLAMGGNPAFYAWQVGLVIALFIASMLFARWQPRSP